MSSPQIDNVMEVLHAIQADVKQRFAANNSIDAFLNESEKKSWLQFAREHKPYGFSTTPFSTNRELMLSVTHDLLVGFYSSKDILFSLQLGARTPDQYTINAGQFIWSLDNKYMLPIGAMFDKIKMTPPSVEDNIICIHAHLSDDKSEMRTLLFSPKYFKLAPDNYIISQHGTWENRTDISDILAIPHIEFPPADPICI